MPKPESNTTLSRRILCWIGLHDWFEGGLAGSDDYRRCIYCEKKQKWYPFAKIWGDL